jgi:hypothetical protein
MNMPGFTAEATLYETSGRHFIVDSFRDEGRSTRNAIQMQATFGDGPPRATLLGAGFDCGGGADGIETCHSCFDTLGHGRQCVCYDCSGGQCTPGYVCTGYFLGLTRPPYSPLTQVFTTRR